MVTSSGGETLYCRGECWLTVYVDDGAACGKSMQKVCGFVLEISQIVQIKPASWLKHFLGIHCHRARAEGRRYLLWEQEAFARNLLMVFVEENGAAPKKAAPAKPAPAPAAEEEDDEAAMPLSAPLESSPPAGGSRPFRLGNR